MMKKVLNRFCMDDKRWWNIFGEKMRIFFDNIIFLRVFLVWINSFLSKLVARRLDSMFVGAGSGSSFVNFIYFFVLKPAFSFVATIFFCWSFFFFSVGFGFLISFLIFRGRRFDGDICFSLLSSFSKVIEFFCIYFNFFWFAHVSLIMVSRYLKK